MSSDQPFQVIIMHFPFLVSNSNNWHRLSCLIWFKVLVYSILLIAATYILGLFVVNINKPDMGNFDETFLLLQFNGFTFSFCRAPFPAVWYIKRKLVLSVKLRSNFTSDSPRVSRLILPFTFRVENTLMRRKVSVKEKVGWHQDLPV